MDSKGASAFHCRELPHSLSDTEIRVRLSAVPRRLWVWAAGFPAVIAGVAGTYGMPCSQAQVLMVHNRLFLLQYFSGFVLFWWVGTTYLRKCLNAPPIAVDGTCARVGSHSIEVDRICRVIVDPCGVHLYMDSNDASPAVFARYDREVVELLLMKAEKCERIVVTSSLPDNKLQGIISVFLMLLGALLLLNHLRPSLL